MESVGVLIAIRCAGCAVIFYVCEHDYRGQIYGSEGCHREARRSANARHQASPEGRLDHRDAMRSHRDRIRGGATPVTDTRSDNLAAEPMSCVRDDASASVMGAHAVGAESTDDATIHSDDAASTARDAAPRDGGERRRDAGAPGLYDRESHSRRSGARAVCCIVCRRPGFLIRDPDDRRPRLRNEEREQRRRGRVPRPPSARSPPPRLRPLR